MFSCFLIEYWSKTGLSLGTTAVAGQSTYMSQCRSYISGREPFFELAGGGEGLKPSPGFTVPEKMLSSQFRMHIILSPRLTMVTFKTVIGLCYFSPLP